MIKRTKMAGALLLALAVTGCGASSDSAPGTTATTTTTDLDAADKAAYAACRQFVSGELKAPNGATFAPFGDVNVASVGDDQLTLTGYVDAENSYGGEGRLRFTCKVVDRSGKWRLLDVDLDES